MEKTYLFQITFMRFFFLVQFFWPLYFLLLSMMSDIDMWHHIYPLRLLESQEGRAGRKRMLNSLL